MYICTRFKYIINLEGKSEIIMTNTNNHGGRRVNQTGRPRLGKKKYLITCYENQIEIIRDFIKKLPKFE